MGSLEDVFPFYRPWVLAILRDLALHGPSKPKDSVERILEASLTSLSPSQVARARKNNYVRWAATTIRKMGWLGSTSGTWELTELGQAMVAKEADTPLVYPDHIAPLDGDSNADTSNGRTETVVATELRGYELPILAVLAEKNVPLQKSEIRSSVFDQVREQLTPGDVRFMPSGMPVWSYRASWALSSLNKRGEIENLGPGLWAITKAGLERNAGAGSGPPSLAPFQNSEARVQLDVEEPDQPSETSRWPTTAWQQLEGPVGPDLLASISSRLRPDLGASPDAARIPRNIILYGPPGTGKTFIAKMVAAALTGHDQPGDDSHWQLVQFHPSYAYEDFVQGLRPDLKQSPLRYELREGPFIKICNAAEQKPDEFFVLVIDEINRGDPARIFGELLYALEYRDETVRLAADGELVVPANLVIVGTMNSVDRSVALVDYALRRRFGFIRIEPDPDIIVQQRGEETHAALAATVLVGFNEWLTGKLSVDHAIGHSFFLSGAVDLSTAGALDEIWRHDIHPLIEEYFFGDGPSIDEARSEWTRLVAVGVP